MKYIKLVSILLSILTLCSCNEKKDPEENIKPNGIWEQQGYGHIIELKDTILKIYDISKQNCNLSYEEEILDFGSIKKFTKDTLTIQHGIDKWVFTRLEKLPDLCASKKELNKNPKYNFQTFWDTFHEHYASFEIKKMDWNEVYKKYESKITENTTDLELYTIFQEIISLLNDGHVSMEIPENMEDDYENKTIQNENKYSKIDEFQINKDLASLYVDSLHNYNAGMVRYGMIKDKMGYVQINSMLMLADYNLAKNLDLRNFYGQYWEVAQKSKNEIQRQEEVDGVNRILDTIIQELKGAESYILDLRFNGGGKDGVAVAILNHFSETEKIGFTKKAKLKNGFTDKQEIRIVPSDIRFTGNVYLLTSNLTASASEILVLASLGNSNFTRIGSTTEGIFSSTLDKKLPNGWEYELSNEVYQDLKGNNYENVGISADIPLNYSQEKDAFLDELSAELSAKKDSAIETAIKLEKEKTE